MNTDTITDIRRITSITAILTMIKGMKGMTSTATDLILPRSKR
jgi:hypothetical protein